MTTLEIEERIKDLREKLESRTDQSSYLYKPINLFESLEVGDILVAKRKNQHDEEEKFVKILDNRSFGEKYYPAVVYNITNLKSEGFMGLSEESWEIIYINKDPKKIDTRFMNFCKNFCIMDCEGCPIKQIINEKT